MRKCLRPKDFFSNWITLNTRDVLSGGEGWLELALSYLVNTEVWGPSEVSKYVLRITQVDSLPINFGNESILIAEIGVVNDI